MHTIELNACAKINLSLDITGRREDGYHTVDMVMQSVSLCDRVRITLNNTGVVRLTCSKPHIPTDIRNTAYKAARYYLDAAGLHYGADIYIEKKIPDQAGMGGGSADAAAVLRGLNVLCTEAEGEAPLNTAELLYIGMRIGADVPFCVLNGTHRCGGVGEILIPLAPMPKCGLVIVKPPVSVSTPEAYKQCDTKPDSGVRYTREMVRAIERRSLPDIAAKLGNRFDDALQIPEVRAIEAALLQAGAMNAVMTGSGSAVFGIFETKAAAEAAAAALDPALGEIFTAEPVSAQEAQL
ncbi:MAG: 4-(cytidine 5'-diphospho)-2-C-methyl-D-erythritol kinase [Clostridia bacterium]|nr:4-(cytidine 5'-diphospho)-2-C-methyl-D-erythritol kinase [Clostridia bacterium]